MEKITPEQLVTLRKLQAAYEADVKPQRAFSDSEYATRLKALRSAMATKGLTGVLLSSPESQCWLHGYQARWYRTGATTEWPPVNFTLVHVGEGDIIVIDSADHHGLIEFTSIAKDIRHPDDIEHPETADPSMNEVHGFVLGTLEKMGWASGKWGLEMWSPRQNAVTTADLVKKLNAERIEAVDVSVMLRDLQRIKSTEELKVMREASRILDVALQHLEKQLNPRMTEIEVWAELEWAMAREGGETAGLHDTVSRTRNYCHAYSSTRVIGHGPLLVDPCGVKHRYHANAARQYFLGDPPKELVMASEIAAGALQELQAVARPRKSFAEISTHLRSYYTDYGMWNDMRDWIGGYQLGIAFTPDWVGEFNWNVDSEHETEKRVEDGLVTNFESFVGGAGFIDTVVFHKDSVEVLSKLDQKLVAI